MHAIAFWMMIKFQSKEWSLDYYHNQTVNCIAADIFSIDDRVLINIGTLIRTKLHD